MIKRIGINKFIVSTVSLFIIVVYSLIPNNDMLTENNTIYNDSVYLLDNDNYLAKVNVFIDSKEIEDIINDKINYLINGKETFKEIIDRNTKINKIIIDKDAVHIYFNKYILKDISRKTIEAIVFSITDINGINDVYLYSEESLIEKAGNIILKYPLNRNFGINSEYDLFDLNTITKTTIFFIKESNGFSYYVPVTKVSNSEEDKIIIIMEELKSSVNSSENLNSYVSNELVIENYLVNDSSVDLIFNNYIYDTINTNKIMESVKYTIGLSVLENYNVKEVTFSTKNDTKIEAISIE